MAQREERHHPARAAAVDEIHRTLMRIGRRLHRGTLPGGLTPHQWMILRSLRCHRDLRPSDLAEHLFVTPGTITPMIDRLIDAGLVARQRDPADRRALRLSLTDAGTALLDAADAAHRRLWLEALDGLSDDELAALRAMLERIDGSLARASAAASKADGTAGTR